MARRKKSFSLKCEYFRYHKTRDQGNSAVSDRAVSDREWIKVMLLGNGGVVKSALTTVQFMQVRFFEVIIRHCIASSFYSVIFTLHTQG